MLDEEINFTDAVDQASQDTDRGIAVQIQNRERMILAQIDEALRRIEAGVFGSCESCGEDISEARLRAQPSTTLCIDCKAEIESQRQKYPGRA
jgi:DnaK suppressor protein